MWLKWLHAIEILATSIFIQQFYEKHNLDIAPIWFHADICDLMTSKVTIYTESIK